jgi:hypothetical protein
VITTTYHGIEYTHRLLWQIVEDQAALAIERGDRRGWFGPSLVAMVFRASHDRGLSARSANAW